MNMKHTGRALLLAMALAGISFTGARAGTSAGAGEPKKASAAEAEQKVDQAYDAMKGYGYAKKQEFVKWADARTTELDRRIAVLRKEVAHADARTKKQLEKEMAELDKKRKELGTRADELKRSSAQAWSDLKWSFAAAVDGLEQAYDRARDRFKEAQGALNPNK